MNGASYARWCCFFGLLGSLAVPCSFAQRTTGSIVGQVKVVPGNDVGRPILIEVEARGAVVESSYTDEEGRFGFSNLLGNVYHIKVNDEDYLPAMETAIIDPATTPVRLVSVMLTPRKKEGQAQPELKGGNRNLINFAEMADLYPKPAVREFKAGAKADRRKKLDDAIKHYEKAVQLAPTFYHARNNLGTDYLTKKSYKAAEEQFIQAVHLNTNDGAAYFNLGNTYFLLAKYDESRQWLDQGLSKEPDSAFGHFLKGSLEAHAGDAAAGEKELLRSLELDPKMAKAHLALVNLYLHQQKSQAAVNELRAFLKNSPNDPLAPQATQVLKRIDPGVQP